MGVDGAHCILPFQRDEYWFFNLKKRMHVEGLPEDELLPICIRITLLDLVWSLEPWTIENMVRLIRTTVLEAKQLRL